jgi:hypothetical protein
MNRIIVSRALMYCQIVPLGRSILGQLSWIPMMIQLELKVDVVLVERMIRTPKLAPLLEYWMVVEQVRVQDLEQFL